MHSGNGHTLGEAAGTSSVTLTQQQMPTHNHLVQAQTESPVPSVNSQNPTNKIFAAPKVGLQGGGTGPVQLYSPATNLTPIDAQSAGNFPLAELGARRRPFHLAIGIGFFGEPESHARIEPRRRI